MDIRFGIRLPPCGPPHVTAKEAHTAEQGGFDVVWIPDSQLLWRDAWTTLAAVALSTERINLGIGVTNPLTRHPTVTACAAASLDELSGGRLILGIGPGDSSVRVMGQKPATTKVMRETIALVRSLTKGDWVSIGDSTVRMKAAEEREEPVPLYVAASRPRMLELAGELADGVILMAGIDDSSLDYAISHVKAGATRAHRDLGDIVLVVGGYCLVADDWQEWKQLARPLAALFAWKRPEVFTEAGVSLPEVPRMGHIYPDIHHAEDWDHAIEITRWVPDGLLDIYCRNYCFMGNAADVCQKVERIAAKGIKEFLFAGFASYALPTELIASFSKDIIPRFGKRT